MRAPRKQRATPVTRQRQRQAMVPPSPADIARRLADPDEPLYTMAVACDLLGVDAQTVRRLDGLQLTTPSRSTGNQRRYSRNDLYRLGAAMMLLRKGMPRSAISQLLAPDAELDELRRQLREDLDL
ncbi:MAG: MerR family transcriptional regulator [Acidimicrobiales bacterium]|nr:MerR family transcriptional regulator [Acidimicrobiales bacterium]